MTNNMDPLSVPASVLGIAAFCAKFVDSAARFVINSKEAPEIITQYYETIHNLQSSLENLGHLLESRPHPLSFEQNHYRNVFKIAQSCRTALEKLDELLPTVPDDPGAWAKARMNFITTLKSNIIQHTLGHIGTYTQVIQLSLTTISLGALWATQRSQSEIMTHIRNLTDSMRNLEKVVAAKQVPTVEVGQAELPEMDAQVAEANSAVARDVQAWLTTANNVATAVSVYTPDASERSVYFDGRSDSGVDVTSEAEVEDIPFSPPETKSHPSREIMQHQFEQNQLIVPKLLAGGIYLKAASYQRKGILWRERLAEWHDVPFDYSDRATMNETLIDILIQSDIRESMSKGRRLLESLLREECNRESMGEDGCDDHRKYRLYHKLGSVYITEGNLTQAIKMLSEAFEGRRALDPMPADLVLESGQLLAKTHLQNQAFDEAAGYLDWMRQNLQPVAASKSASSLAPMETEDLAFAWCKEQGFNVEAVDFSFDESDSSQGQSPLHLAVKMEKYEVLRQMVSHVVSFEHRDADFATPLLLAASTRSSRITGLLLDYGAKVDVRDHSGKLPLHRCQAKAGGVGVAKLLLERRSDLIDSPDSMNRTALFMAVENGNVEMAEILLGVYGANPDLKESYERTPLYRACELGNSDMVRVLLHYGAKPNIRGPGLRTPLIAAIDDNMSINCKIRLVSMLMDRAADPAIPDADGKSAFDAATKSGFGTELKGLLLTRGPHRASTYSIASSGSRTSSSSMKSQSSWFGKFRSKG